MPGFLRDSKGLILLTCTGELPDAFGRLAGVTLRRFLLRNLFKGLLSWAVVDVVSDSYSIKN